MKITIEKEKCIGCGMCESMCDKCFSMDDNKAKVIKEEGCDKCDVNEIAENCPVNAIKIEI